MTITKVVIPGSVMTVDLQSNLFTIATKKLLLNPLEPDTFQVELTDDGKGGLLVISALDVYGEKTFMLPELVPDNL